MALLSSLSDKNRHPAGDADGLQLRRSADVSLLVAGILMNLENHRI